MSKAGALLLGLTPTTISLLTRSGAEDSPREPVGCDGSSQIDEARSASLRSSSSSCSVLTAHVGVRRAASNLNVNVDGIGGISAPLQIVLVLTLLSFLPAMLVIMTSFTRIVIVFHFLRQALGTQEMPSNQILIGLTLFLTMFIMAPVADAVNDAGRAAGDGRPDRASSEALDAGAPPLRDFMLKQTREADLALFVELGDSCRARPRRTTCRCASSFRPIAISELKTGFQMGFFLFVPFLLIDLVVSTTLLSMGMLQLPPAMISLPFKMLLFVMVDGWNLLVSSLVRSFAVKRSRETVRNRPCLKRSSSASSVRRSRWR